MICRNTLCADEFKPARTRQKFCSPDCCYHSRRKTDIRKLYELVAKGESKTEISRQLNASRRSVRRWIAEYGLEGTWREARTC